MKPMIHVVVPYRERLEFDFATSTLIPLYEAQAKSGLINTLRSRMWENDEAQTLLEEQNPLKEFRLTVSKMLMDDTPFLPASRNRLAQAAQWRGADFIYWLDSDINCTAVIAQKAQANRMRQDGYSRVSRARARGTT